MQNKIRICEAHKQEIFLFCSSQFCIQEKLLCDTCLKKDLHIHNKDLNRIQILNQFIDDNNSSSKKLTEQLDLMIQKTIKMLNKLKEGIVKKFQISKSQIDQINNTQLSQFITNIIQFQTTSQNIIKEIMPNFSNINNSIEQCLQDLKLEQVDETERLYKLGFTSYQDKQQYEEAIGYFEKALKLNNNHIDSLWCKGDSLRKLRKFEEAIQCFDKAIKIDQSHVMSLYGKGEALRGLSKFKESLKFYDDALKLDQQHYRAYYGKGEALRSLGKIQEALECQNNSIQIFPKNSQSLGSKGACLIQLNKFKEAQQVIEQAKLIDPQSQFLQNLIQILNQNLK